MQNTMYAKQIAILTLFAGSPAVGQFANFKVGSDTGSDTLSGEPTAPPGVLDEFWACNLFTSLEGIKSAPDGAMVYFDVAVASWPIELHSIGQNVASASGTPYQFDLYTTPDTSIGKESNKSLWTLRASGEGLSRGTGNLSYAVLSNRFTLDANSSYGVGIVLTGGGHRYHNGNGTNEFYENEFFSMKMGTIQWVPFGTSLFSPRIWNGMIEYNSPTCGCKHACEFDTAGPCVCDIFDFLVFQNGFVSGEPCSCEFDTSTGIGVCDIFDFLAFQTEFVKGCP